MYDSIPGLITRYIDHPTVVHRAGSVELIVIPTKSLAQYSEVVLIVLRTTS